MPSLTVAAHARAAMGAHGGAILKASGLNSVLESNQLDSSKAAAPAASATRKNAVVLNNGSRKKTAACPAAVTVCFPPHGYLIINLTMSHRYAEYTYIITSFTMSHLSVGCVWL